MTGTDISSQRGNREATAIPSPGVMLEDLVQQAQAAFETFQQHIRKAEAAGTAATTSQTQATAILAELQAKLQEVGAIATQATAAKTSIADTQSVIATKSDHIQKAQEHADKVRGDLDRVFTAAQAKLAEVEGVQTRSGAVSESIAEMQAAVQVNKAASEVDAEAIRKSLAVAKEASDQTKKLADTAAQVDERVAAYEEKLGDLEKQCKARLDEITGLLPGATSAGLASAFDERRKTFLGPGDRWQKFFVGSVLALVLLSVTGLVQLYIAPDALDYGKLMRVWLARFPVAAALVWLALYASREAALAKRLEEDYGYKSAIAASFQGFYKQMQDIHAAAGPESPLGKLCNDTLATLASPPGRIYDKHQLTITPAAELADVAKALADAAKTRLA